jgi:hypothetical protein
MKNTQVACSREVSPCLTFKQMIPAIDEILISARKTKSITTGRKSMLKLVKLQSLVATCCKMRKI